MDAQKARIVMKYTDLLLLCKCCEVGTRPLYRWFNGPVLLVQRLWTVGTAVLYHSGDEACILNFGGCEFNDWALGVYVSIKV